MDPSGLGQMSNNNTERVLSQLLEIQLRKTQQTSDSVWAIPYPIADRITIRYNPPMSKYEKIMVLVVLVITVALIKVGWFLVDLYYAG